MAPPKWYEAQGNSVDLRDPMGSTNNYTAENVGVAALPAGSSVSASDTLANGGLITITIPVTAFGNGGRISSEMVVVRPMTETDIARYGGDSIANITATDADVEATYRPLAVWLW